MILDLIYLIQLMSDSSKGISCSSRKGGGDGRVSTCRRSWGSEGYHEIQFVLAL